ncbi:MAG: radical SAM protein [Anaerolineae bacterium]
MDEKACRVCGRRSPLIAEALGVCADCLRTRFDESRGFVEAAHRESRRTFGLPVAPPDTGGGVGCQMCANACRMGPGERGFCGLRENRSGRLFHHAGTPARGLLHWYRDPLPTNCVADWVCAGHRQWGCHNLAVFYGACTFDCLFCQNWHFREMDPTTARPLSAEELANKANRQTYCVCYFGGDPAAQMPHALAASRLLAERGVVVCWETNGSAHPRLLDRAFDLSLKTGGCVKFDLKALDEGLHQALTGVSSRQTLQNFTRLGKRARERPEPPPVVASTLLVPGYVDAQEVRRLAEFIAGVDPEIPLSLLGFHPNFFMPDLPCTSVRHAQEAEAAAREAGLRRVHVGNRHLLSRDY